uniref:Uncharacterized protein n=1 Tax=Chromera velia CCMP2878 TaxID=1169474 RepID=A0A0G4HLA5_9ALVE|eukprot:Cvel_28939.t1-p1 / transcript=Cvel_28939.t1 / gene=Cvel_28939 / organism=Chromera_velia_CCMP2878 / gene_product=Ankyrin-3, putative / transcript_product=Ankyrin-3, putative / location=Cvel_scaffold3878:1730-3469(-) / protein_length=580 / sequence_SO=supercontig / SO=protein_coding / is_pseudo=false
MQQELDSSRAVERLNEFKTRLLRLTQNANKKIDTLTKLMRDRETESIKASADSQTEDATQPLPFKPPTSSALDSLEVSLSTFQREIHGQLDTQVGRYYKMDLSRLFRKPLLRDAIHSFRTVTKEALREELSAFISGKSNGDGFRLCLKVGADVDGFASHLDQWGLMALMRAVSEGHALAVELLVRDGGNLEIKTEKSIPLLPLSEKPQATGLKLKPGFPQTPAAPTMIPQHSNALMLACHRQFWEIAKFLLDEGANADAVDAEGNTALQIVCQICLRPHNPNSFHALPSFKCLSADQQLTAKEVFQALLLKTPKAMVKKMRAGTKGQMGSLLHVSARIGLHQFASSCLSMGVDVNSIDERGDTPLLLAVRHADAVLLDRFIQAGAIVSVTSRDGETALHSIAQCSPNFYRTAESAETSKTRVSIAKILLQKRVPLNAVSRRSGFTALHEAVKLGDPALVEFLLQKGAKPQSKGAMGEQPLHLLCVGRVEFGGEEQIRMDAEKIVKLLTDHGADINAVTWEGRTALHLAVRRATLLELHPNSASAKALAEVLRESGANPHIKDMHGKDALQTKDMPVQLYS